jgi:DNA-binding GntR family transcriptional regulator
MLPWLAEAPPGLITSVRDTSLGKLVRDEMLALILRGEFAPGQRINEPDVAARLRVSRVPVREALRELESSGLLAARKHSGVFVRVLDRKEVADLYELRSVLDGHAGRRAAELPTAPRQALAKKLAAALREMKAHARRHDVPAYYASNLSFHWMIVEAAANEQLARTYRGIVQQLHLARLKNLSHDIGMRASLVEHEQILAALSGGDAERCQALLASHVTASHGRLLKRLDADLS